MGMHAYDLIGMFLAVLFGAIIGTERQLSGKAAGLRTNILICLGAAVYTIVSREMGGGSTTALPALPRKSFPASAFSAQAQSFRTEAASTALPPPRQYGLLPVSVWPAAPDFICLRRLPPQLR